MQWPWCSIEEPARTVSPGWLPYYHGNQLSRSGGWANLGIFDLLREGVRHRWASLGWSPPPTLGSNNPVTTGSQAQTTLSQLWDDTLPLLGEGGYVQPSGQRLQAPGPPRGWPEGVLDLVELLTNLRYTGPVTLMEVDEMVKVSDGAFLPVQNETAYVGSWTVPRFIGCRAVREVSLHTADPLVSRGTSYQDGFFSNVVARRDCTQMMTPVDGPMLVTWGGSGERVVSFDLRGVSSVPPVGYVGGFPPPNCDYDYFLVHDASPDPLQAVNIKVNLNGEDYFVNGSAYLNVTSSLKAQNVLTLSPWHPGSPSSWRSIRLMEVLAFEGHPVPVALPHQCRMLRPLACLPWYHNGSEQRVAFRVDGIVEAAAEGPFLAPVTSWPAARLDARPHFVDVGYEVRASFSAPHPPGPWVATLLPIDPAGVQIQVGQGVVSSEITKFSFSIPVSARQYRLTVTCGNSSYQTVLIGPRPTSRFCVPLSYCHDSYYGDA